MQAKIKYYSITLTENQWSEISYLAYEYLELAYNPDEKRVKRGYKCVQALDKKLKRAKTKK